MNPGMVRDLVGTVDSQRAEMGLMITMTQPTARMLEAANHSGIYTTAANGRTYPKVQIITVEELLAGRRPQLPPVLPPYIAASRVQAPAADQLTFGDA